MLFKNLVSGEELSHVEFVRFVWDETERQFNECHDDEDWCNLTKDEQIELYCSQYEHQLSERDWTICLH